MKKNGIVPIVVFAIGAAIVAGLFVFQRKCIDYNQYVVVNTMALLWVPMLSILLVFREEPAKFGFSLGSWGRIWPFMVIGFIGLFVLMLHASRLQVFQDYYPIFRRFTYPLEFRSIFSGSPWEVAPWLTVYAAASYGFYMFCWEFFFRGYLLFGMQRSMGWWAVLVQAFAFGLLHIGKPGLEVVASFGAGVILGIIALNAKSFVPCFVLHWAASLTFDVMIVATRSTGSG